MAVADLSVNLPWQALQGQAGMLQGLGGNPQQAMAQLGQNYSNAYTGALNLNAGLYGGIQTGYQNLRSQLDNQYAGISQGYQKLYGDVLGKIAGTNSSNLTDIDTHYSAQAGQASQDMVNRGLGNSTVQQNMQRAIALDRERARTNSQESFAQLQAGYMSQLGQAGLGAQREGAQLGTQVGQNQLNWLNTVQAPYPHAGMYTDLAKMYGASAQAQQDRQAMQQAGEDAMGGAGTWVRGGVGGVVSGAGGNTMPFGPRMNYGSNMDSSARGSPYNVTDFYGGASAGGTWGSPDPRALQMAQAGGFSPGSMFSDPNAFAGGYEYDQGYGGVDMGGLGGFGDSGYGGLPGGYDDYA